MVGIIDRGNNRIRASIGRSLDVAVISHIDHQTIRSRRRCGRTSGPVVSLCQITERDRGRGFADDQCIARTAFVVGIADRGQNGVGPCVGRGLSTAGVGHVDIQALGRRRR